MTAFKRQLSGVGISLLVHALITAAVFWWWLQPPEEEAGQVPPSWDVNLFNSLPPPPAPIEARLEEDDFQPVESSVEPAAAEVMQASMAPATPRSGQVSTVVGLGVDMPKLTLATGNGSPGATVIPMAGIGSGMTGVPGSGEATGGRLSSMTDLFGGNSQLSPIVRIPPTYPLEARRKKIQGWVKVEFTVLEDGTVTGSRVKAAEPVGVFEQAALAAIAQWKFNPVSDNGKPVRKRASQTLKFELNG